MARITKTEPTACVSCEEVVMDYEPYEQRDWPTKCPACGYEPDCVYCFDSKTVWSTVAGMVARCGDCS